MKIIVIGEYESAKYHCFKGIDDIIFNLLKDQNEVTISDDFDMFQYENLSKFDICICYIDAFDRPVEPAQSAGILQYIAGGKKMLNIHSGISLDEVTSLAQMLGGSFAGHPEHEEIEYRAVGQHPINNRIDPFVLDEEPYLYDFKYGTQVEIFLEYNYRGEAFPAGWTTTYGLGKIVCLQPGHSKESFEHSSIQRLIVNSVEWLANN